MGMAIAAHTMSMGTLFAMMSVTATPEAFEVMPGAPCMTKSVVRAHP